MGNDISDIEIEHTGSSGKVVFKGDGKGAGKGIPAMQFTFVTDGDKIKMTMPDGNTIEGTYDANSVTFGSERPWTRKEVAPAETAGDAGEKGILTGSWRNDISDIEIEHTGSSGKVVFKGDGKGA